MKVVSGETKVVITLELCTIYVTVINYLEPGALKELQHFCDPNEIERHCV